MNPIADNAIMLKVKSGDLDKMGLLFERYHKPLFGFIYRMTGQKEASEDMVQSVFYRMIHYRTSFTGDGEFRTWMYHLARNVIKDHVKKNRNFREGEDLNGAASKIGGGSMPDEVLQKKQELALLQQALAGLNEESREVLVLSRYQELRYEEIARILNISESNVKVRVFRALQQLKNLYLQLER